tara:strand:+ start:124 stop:375 length:252 start_codon:yes stop_codon:yes gene_type:complete
MKFVSFIFIFITILFTVSLKLLVANQETQIKSLNKQLIELETIIEKTKTDISYSTRPQKLNDLNIKEFKLELILQSDIETLKE